MEKISEDIGEKFDDTMVQAEKMAADEKANPTSEFADTPLDASGSLLDDTDDFFSKAAAYAEGDHHSFSEGKITITPSEDVTDQVAEEVKQIKAAGFEGAASFEAFAPDIHDMTDPTAALAGSIAFIT